MVEVEPFFVMLFCAFISCKTMDKVDGWIAHHRDEKKERMGKEAEMTRMREELRTMGEELRKMREELHQQQRERDSRA